MQHFIGYKKKLLLNIVEQTNVPHQGSYLRPVQHLQNESKIKKKLTNLPRSKNINIHINAMQNFKLSDGVVSYESLWVQDVIRLRAYDKNNQNAQISVSFTQIFIAFGADHIKVFWNRNTQNLPKNFVQKFQVKIFGVAKSGPRLKS